MPERHVADELSAVRPAAAWLDTVIADALCEEVRNDAQVCLEESLANLILHGRPRGETKDIRIEVELSGSAVALIVRDRCVPFDVTDDSLDRATPDAEIRIGGHGLKLLRAFARDLEYRASPGGNELRMMFPRKASRPVAELDLIRTMPAFAGLPDAELDALWRASSAVTFPPSELILEQGSASDHAFILLSGHALVLSHSHHGDAALATVTAPALIGEIGALSGSRRTASVRAESEVLALRINGAALLELGKHAPDLLVSVVGRLGQQIQNINDALGLYAAGFAALERDDFDATVIEELNNPTDELRGFAAAFRGLARRVTLERRTRSEMANAALIQAAMLPPPLDHGALRARCDAFGAMKPAREVGGDLYDLFTLDGDRLGMVIGDVCGKGVPAALFMSVTVTALRLASRAYRDLPALIASANDTLCANNSMSMFSTLFYGVLDLSSRRFSYVNCGHNPPLLIRRSGDCIELPGRAPPLGLFPDRAWPHHEVQLEAGEGLFLFTDGVTECTSSAGEEYGDARLAELLREKRHLSASELVSTVTNDALRFAGEQEQFDDITCVAAFLR